MSWTDHCHVLWVLCVAPRGPRLSCLYFVICPLSSPILRLSFFLFFQHCIRDLVLPHLFAPALAHTCCLPCVCVCVSELWSFFFYRIKVLITQHFCFSIFTFPQQHQVKGARTKALCQFAPKLAQKCETFALWESKLCFFFNWRHTLGVVLLPLSIDNREVFKYET